MSTKKASSKVLKESDLSSLSIFIDSEMGNSLLTCVIVMLSCWWSVKTKPAVLPLSFEVNRTFVYFIILIPVVCLR